jgi:hypothetical protein
MALQIAPLGALPNDRMGGYIPSNEGRVRDVIMAKIAGELLGNILTNISGGNYADKIQTEILEQPPKDMSGEPFYKRALSTAGRMIRPPVGYGEYEAAQREKTRQGEFGQQIGLEREKLGEEKFKNTALIGETAQRMKALEIENEQLAEALRLDREAKQAGIGQTQEQTALMRPEVMSQIGLRGVQQANLEEETPWIAPGRAADINLNWARTLAVPEELRLKREDQAVGRDLAKSHGKYYDSAARATDLETQTQQSRIDRMKADQFVQEYLSGLGQKVPPGAEAMARRYVESDTTPTMIEFGPWKETDRPNKPKPDTPGPAPITGTAETLVPDLAKDATGALTDEFLLKALYNLGLIDVTPPRGQERPAGYHPIIRAISRRFLGVNEGQ